MKKENVHIKAIRYFYDIVGELDEVSYATLTNFGNNMYMLFMTVTLVSFLVSFALGEDVMGISLFLTLVYSQFKQDAIIKQLGLDKLFVAKADVKLARKKMMKRTLFQTLQIAVYGLLVSIGLWQLQIPQESGTSAAEYFQFVTPMTVVLMTLVGFLSFYIVNRKKIKLI
ncbi:DUF3278 domain-containing protein [Streptococcus suis]|uniref:Protein of uncharacterized function (DUF3278) n=1 Tax=Streptococcus suis TaxID=1307 RepID=A0A0Z8MB64_STRSU|nr:MULTISPECIES: DUF3278 domain-containing protein [Streptococcus]MBM7267525.1 DUF3278 domain-containing protein [Streptococcus suis]MBO4126224.1 DUF3278 domain-containing protein [Streptococcus suis]MBY0752689.1 DUF3278 domain-containing protein [Streptococcus sp. 2018037]MCO8183326.1 DUF3278 domain-containing protein [Streptococcus suis]MCO8214873.1 DUF3278 domain-containing protein [Streptococcus suis]